MLNFSAIIFVLAALLVNPFDKAYGQAYTGYSGYHNLHFYDMTADEMNRVRDALGFLGASGYNFYINHANIMYPTQTINAYWAPTLFYRAIAVWGDGSFVAQTYVGSRDVYFARNYLNAPYYSSRGSMASVLFHEAAHQYAGSHTCGAGGDRDDLGVYGAQAYYLAQVKNHGALNSSERWYAESWASSIAHHNVCGNGTARTRILNALYYGVFPGFHIYDGAVFKTCNEWFPDRCA